MKQTPTEFHHVLILLFIATATRSSGFSKEMSNISGGKAVLPFTFSFYFFRSKESRSEWTSSGIIFFMHLPNKVQKGIFSYHYTIVIIK